MLNIGDKVIILTGEHTDLFGYVSSKGLNSRDGCDWYYQVCNEDCAGKQEMNRRNHFIMGNYKRHELDYFNSRKDSCNYCGKKIGTITAGTINALTITGGTVRTASSGQRRQGINMDNIDIAHINFTDKDGLKNYINGALLGFFQATGRTPEVLWVDKDQKELVNTIIRPKVYRKEYINNSFEGQTFGKLQIKVKNLNI